MHSADAHVKTNLCDSYNWNATTHQRRKIQRHTSLATFSKPSSNPPNTTNTKLATIKMNVPSISTLILVIFLVDPIIMMASASPERLSRRPFGMPSFLRRPSLPLAFCSPQPQQRRRTQEQYCFGFSRNRFNDVRQCGSGSSNNEDDEPSDCEARFAVEYGYEQKFVRAAEHAYLLHGHEEEFSVVPASNTRIVPTTRRPLESELVVT